MEQTPHAWNNFYLQGRHVANIIKEAQRNHYKQIIQEHKHDYRKQESLLPLTRLISVLAEDFSEFFFQTKIDNIIEKLREKASDLDNKYIETNFQTNYRMNKFTPVIHSDVKEPAKSCKLDPIPTSLLNVHIDLLAPIISNITNSSLKREYSLMNLRMLFCVLFINIIALNSCLGTLDLSHIFLILGKS